MQIEIHLLDIFDLMKVGGIIYDKYIRILLLLKNLLKKKIYNTIIVNK